MGKNLAIGAAVVAALVVLVLFGRSWLEEHDARKDAEAIAKQAQASIAASQQSIAQRDALLKQAQATLAAQQASVLTTPQAVKIITQTIPAIASSPAPPVVVEKSQLTPAEHKALPDAPSYAIFTQDQAVAVAKDGLQCKSDQLALATCKQDLVDETDKFTESQTESAAWQKAAKGTKWGNFFHALKCIGLSGGGAAIGSLADKQNPGVGAAVGGGAGAVTCALWR